MEEIDVRHIHVLELPKLLLWTDRDLEYFLEEMPSEERRMNNDIYDVFIKEIEAGKDYQPEEAFNLAYYECVRISLAKYPESKDLFDVLEMDIQNHQSEVNYGYTYLIMNMVWAMLHSTGTAPRFADKLHTYLVNSKKLEYGFRSFFTPNDFVHHVFPYNEKEEPRYNVIFTPCPKDIEYKSSNGEWCELTIGYKEHLIEELLMLWPEGKRDYIRKCIMDEKARQMNNFARFWDAQTDLYEAQDQELTGNNNEMEQHPSLTSKSDNGKMFKIGNPVNKSNGNVWKINPIKKKNQSLGRIVYRLTKRVEQLERTDSLTPPPLLAIAERKMTSLLVALDVMFNAGWFSPTVEDEMPDRNTALGDIIHRAFGIDCPNVQQLLSTPKSRVFKGEDWRQKYFNELKEAFDNYDEIKAVRKARRKKK